MIDLSRFGVSVRVVRLLSLLVSGPGIWSATRACSALRKGNYNIKLYNRIGSYVGLGSEVLAPGIETCSDPVTCRVYGCSWGPASGPGAPIDLVHRKGLLVRVVALLCLDGARSNPKWGSNGHCGRTVRVGSYNCCRFVGFAPFAGCCCCCCQSSVLFVPGWFNHWSSWVWPRGVLT